MKVLILLKPGLFDEKICFSGTIAKTSTRVLFIKSNFGSSVHSYNFFNEANINISFVFLGENVEFTVSN